MLVKDPTIFDSVPALSEHNPPPYDAVWEQSLAHVHQGMAVHYDGEQEGHELMEGAGAQKQADMMPDVKDSRRRVKWFTGARKTVRRGIMNEVGGLVRLVLLVPRVVIGTALHIVGATVQTAGLVVGRLGDSLSETMTMSSSARATGTQSHDTTE